MRIWTYVAMNAMAIAALVTLYCLTLSPLYLVCVVVVGYAALYLTNDDEGMQ